MRGRTTNFAGMMLKNAHLYITEGKKYEIYRNTTSIRLLIRAFLFPINIYYH